MAGGKTPRACATVLGRGQMCFRDVLQELNDAIEKQRTQFAKIDQDEPAQLLALTHLRLSQATCNPKERCVECFNQLQRILERIDVQLPPLAVHGVDLIHAVRCTAVNTLKGRDVAVTVEGFFGRDLGNSQQLMILRVIQEALTNVARHAHASKVTIRVYSARGLRICIRDNGVGFSPSEILSGKHGVGLGLLGMSARVKRAGGSVSVTSEPGKGTEILLKLSWEAAQQESPSGVSSGQNDPFSPAMTSRKLASSARTRSTPYHGSA